MHIITSVNNEQVKHIVSLHQVKGRKKADQFFAEGRRFVREALLSNAPIDKIYYCPEKNEETEGIKTLIAEALKSEIEVEEVSAAVMRKMSDTEEPQGILALIKRPEFTWANVGIEPDTILLVLDGIRDPGNLGTILRTALAAGVNQVVMTPGTVDLYNPKVLRSSMGAVFSMYVLVDRAAADIRAFCREHHLRLAVSALEGESIFSVPIKDEMPIALVIGSEATGVSREFSEYAEKKLTIPMQNEVDSLNAALAAGILLFEIQRQCGFLKMLK